MKTFEPQGVDSLIYEVTGTSYGSLTSYRRTVVNGWRFQSIVGLSREDGNSPGGLSTGERTG